jgi:pimeloyl-ACP methyl ester carboxylesterase
LYRICTPDPTDWNGDLVVFAHGYVAPDEPLAIPEPEVPGGFFISELFNGLGFAFATTSYSTNGLAVREGMEDLRDLVDIFRATYHPPRHVYLIGASEGGLITTLAVERFPDIFDGGLALCGPIGDLREQINYEGDFRTVFDYFFPDLIPGSPTNVPQEVMDHWDTVYLPRIRYAIWSNPSATEQLLRVTHAPVDWRIPPSVDTTIVGLLWHSVFGANDAIVKLGGQPFHNAGRFYSGSDNDWQLNRNVQRFRADPAALNEIEAHYQTSGRLASPLVTLHTTGDPLVPYWHEPLYRNTVLASGSRLQFIGTPVNRYGHCSFKTSEVVGSFMLLVFKVTGQKLTGVERVLLDADEG